MTQPLFTGVGVALVTLFDDDGEVDAKATADHAAALVELGVRAVIVAGSTGEAATLAEAERTALLTEVRQAVPSGTPVLAYHFPQVSAPGIPVDVLPDLPVHGLKDSSGDPDRLLRERTTYNGWLYVGAATLLALAGPLACSGAILALANAEPERCSAAFAGDAEAQLALAEAHMAAQRNFPHGLKALVADRFGTSRVARLG